MATEKNVDKKLEASLKHLECLKKKCNTKEFEKYISTSETVISETQKVYTMLKNTKEINKEVLDKLNKIIQLTKSLNITKKLVKCAADNCLDTLYELERLNQETRLAQAQIMYNMLVHMVKKKTG